ncbi:thiamine biosynthetic bifunctional enzyme Thi4 [Panaeolus papilionaceus]|nr:thiamine biosynthetic bifunctional enzyme Thi4 [Panaeolus papilionaceus]
MPWDKSKIDYSIYLVTGRNLLPPNKDYLESLEESIKGGVTFVQIREKDIETEEFIRVASQSKVICQKYNVPMVINDRIDVALAVNADGLHLGQTDMSVRDAQRVLPPGSIIGVSCNNVGHIKQAIEDGVDYVGIGAVYGTQTKKLLQPIIGVRGVGAMLAALDGTGIKSVAIGGIKATNLLRTLHGVVSTTGHSLDGVAVVSDIVASQTPKLAAESLSQIFQEFQSSFNKDTLGLEIVGKSDSSFLTQDDIMEGVTKLVKEIRKLNPLVHQITNTVVATQSANVTLAVGASPIMASEPLEMEDMSRICGALLVNIGTMRADTLEPMLIAGTSANKFQKPIVFDPVGVGASAFRKANVKTLLDHWQASVIKANAGEIATLADNAEVLSKGVDSVGSGFNDPASVVKSLARRERCVVVLTGATDYISDGVNVVSLSNGRDVLGQITGSGCILGSCIASYCATAAHLSNKDPQYHNGTIFRGDMFTAAIAGVLVLTVAAEIAAERSDVRGPGTFLPGLIDTLWTLAPEEVRTRAKLSLLTA